MVYQGYANDGPRGTFDLSAAWSKFSGQVAVVILEKMLHVVCFTQVSESWPMGLLFL